MHVCWNGSFVCLTFERWICICMFFALVGLSVCHLKSSHACLYTSLQSIVHICTLGTDLYTCRKVPLHTRPYNLALCATTDCLWHDQQTYACIIQFPAWASSMARKPVILPLCIASIIQLSVAFNCTYIMSVLAFLLFFNTASKKFQGIKVKRKRVSNRMQSSVVCCCRRPWLVAGATNMAESPS